MSDLFELVPGPGYGDPLGMIATCHRRMERQLDTLGRLLRHLPEHHADADARSAAHKILRYFDIAAVQHHQDEEQSLMPRLKAAHPPAAALLQSLADDHEQLEQAWHNLRPLLAAIAAGSSGYLPVKDVNDFRAAYAAHIAREDAHVLPLAADVMDATALAAIGREIEARRAALA